MNRSLHFEIIIELCGLCEDVIKKTREGLSYYQISTYKEESKEIIEENIRQLQLIAKLLCSANLKDYFQDYKAETNTQMIHNQLNIDNSPCSLTLRVTRLIANIESELNYIKNDSFKKTSDQYNLRQSVRKFRTDLLGISMKGSKAWDFFQSV